MKTNKEIIANLTAYFLQREPENVAKMLACLMIDVNRLAHIDELDEQERASLIVRTEFNLLELNLFIKDGPDGSLNLHDFNK